MAANLLREAGATGCTDVTGFGLMGHLGEMTRASQVRLEGIFGDGFASFFHSVDSTQTRSTCLRYQTPFQHVQCLWLLTGYFVIFSHQPSNPRIILGFCMQVSVQIEAAFLSWRVLQTAQSVALQALCFPVISRQLCWSGMRKRLQSSRHGRSHLTPRHPVDCWQGKACLVLHIPDLHLSSCKTTLIVRLLWLNPTGLKGCQGTPLLEAAQYILPLLLIPLQ